ncbi:hypothetical protein SDC9_109178 [bioreactor metagenome]|uniref:Uncharacterized protein n=1 Tax=bioreactor metagenome TaxID=1076179 RepID=A0A645BAG4_9ZZZZ
MRGFFEKKPGKKLNSKSSKLKFSGILKGSFLKSLLSGVWGGARKNLRRGIYCESGVIPKEQFSNSQIKIFWDS